MSFVKQLGVSPQKAMKTPSETQYVIRSIGSQLRSFRLCFEENSVSLMTNVTVILNTLANLISKLNFYKLIPYPMDNC